jgi:hypothetical protein
MRHQQQQQPQQQEDDARVESIEAMSSAGHALLETVNVVPRVNLVPTGISSHTREAASYQDPHREVCV